MEQIRYYSWNADLAPGHENYWIDIAFIAKTIALFLEGVNPKVLRKDDILKYRSVTIAVEDYKEKFGEPRVYCRLGAFEQVQELYRIEDSVFLPMSEFHESCLCVDISHYRQTYFTIKKIWPQYWDAIYAGAQHKEYLQDSKAEFLTDHANSMSDKDRERAIRTIYYDKL